MLELSCIFVPVSFDRHSRVALTRATLLAGKNQARVHLFHVVPPMLRYFRRSLFPYAGLGEDAVEVQHEVQENARKDLEHYLGLSSAHGKHKDLALAFEVRSTPGDEPSFGLWGERLVETDADLVVIGRSSHNAEGLSPQHRRLLAEARRPVWLVRDVPTNPEGPVIAALDLSGTSKAVLQTATEAALLLQTSLEIVVVIPTPSAFELEGVVSRALSFELRDFQRRASRDVRKSLDNLLSGVDIPFSWAKAHKSLSVQHKLLWGDPAAALEAHVAASEAQLLVVGNRRTAKKVRANRLGRNAATIATWAACDVLVVPSPTS